jgi:hypothetical protein
MEAFNIFNARVSDIDYFYRSRLPGEPAGGIEDIHLHPAVPRSARLGVDCPSDERAHESLLNAAGTEEHADA